MSRNKLLLPPSYVSFSEEDALLEIKWKSELSSSQMMGSLVLKVTSSCGSNSFILSLNFFLCTLSVTFTMSQ